MIDNMLRRNGGMKLFGYLCVLGLMMTSFELRAYYSTDCHYPHDAGFDFYVSKDRKCTVVGFTESVVEIPASIDTMPVERLRLKSQADVWVGGKYVRHKYDSSILRGVTIPSSVRGTVELEGENLISIVIEPGTNELDVSLNKCSMFSDLASFPENVTALWVTSSDALTGIAGVAPGIKNLNISECKNLSSATLPGGLQIARFDSCSNLAEIKLSNGLKSLQLNECPMLTSLALPESLTGLGMNGCGSLRSLSFYDMPIDSISGEINGCTNLEIIVQLQGTRFPKLVDLKRLKSVKIADGVRELCDWAITHCSAEEIIVPNSVTNIGVYCFQGCRSLKDVNISGLTCECLPEGAFESSGVEHVTLPCGLKTIGWNAFLSCSKLKSIEIPDSVEIIRQEAFAGCTALKEIILKNVKHIGVDAFYRCTGLVSVEMRGGIRTLCNGSFRGCINLQCVDIEGVGFEVASRLLPGDLISSGVAPFFECSNIVSVALSPKDAFGYSRDIMPNSMSRIRELEVVEGVTNVDAVYCGNLTRLVLPATMEAFSAPVYNNPNLGEIIVSAENPRFAAKDGILYDKGMTTVIACGCAKTKVELPGTVKAIGKNAFRNCIRIEDVKFPMSVGDIGGSSFYGCTNLASMTLSECLTNIAASAFYKCTRLQDVEFPCALENIGDNAFAYCNNLSEVKLHDGLLVGRGAFSYCSGLRNAIVGKVKVSDVRTGQGLFGECVNLTDVVIDDDASWLGWSSAFGGCKKLQQVKLPRNWKVIPSQIFYGCVSLSDFEIGNEVESIDNNAFYYCSSLRSVRIPAATTNVANYAFYGVAMKEAVFEGDLPVLQSKCYLIDNAAKVYYPRQFAEHYLPVVPAEKFGGYTEDNQFVKSGEGRLMAIPTSWVNEVFDAHPELKEAWSGNVGGFVQQPTGKSYGGEGGAFVWHDYVAGTDPTDPEDVFTATIEFEDGMPRIKYVPELTEHQKALRKYVVYGKKSLADGTWSIVSEGCESDYSFFKVSVDLK